MVFVRHPKPEDIEEYRAARANDQPTCLPMGAVPAGFVHDVVSREIGIGNDVLDHAREGLRRWAAHRNAGVEVYPSGAPLVAGETVALVTRHLGVWLIAGCRIVEVVDAPDRYGFTYATLPGHPERGWETFVVSADEAVVQFRIEAVSQPAATIVRLGSPIARRIQTRTTLRYLDGLERWTRSL